MFRVPGTPVAEGAVGVPGQPGAEGTIEAAPPAAGDVFPMPGQELALANFGQLWFFVPTDNISCHTAY